MGNFKSKDDVLYDQLIDKSCYVLQADDIIIKKIFPDKKECDKITEIMSIIINNQIIPTDVIRIILGYYFEHTVRHICELAIQKVDDVKKILIGKFCVPTADLAFNCKMPSVATSNLLAGIT